MLGVRSRFPGVDEYAFGNTVATGREWISDAAPRIGTCGVIEIVAALMLPVSRFPGDSENETAGVFARDWEALCSANLWIRARLASVRSWSIAQTWRIGSAVSSVSVLQDRARYDDHGRFIAARFRVLRHARQRAYGFGGGLIWSFQVSL